MDLFHGTQDLAEGVLRTPRSPQESFSEDPLRMMRAARFAARFNLTVAPEVFEAMRQMAPRIEIISAERVRDELIKLICADYPRVGLNLLVETGLADYVLPELPALRMEMDPSHHHKDVYEHSLKVMEQAIEKETDADGSCPAPDFVLRFASLLHDIGKPKTRRFEKDGSVSFCSTMWLVRAWSKNGCALYALITTPSRQWRASWSFICASTATVRPGGPTRRYVDMCGMQGAAAASPQAFSVGCHHAQ